MPYDAAKTRQLLSIAGAHTQNPAAEYIEALVEQLREAESAISGAVASKLKADGDANRYSSELETAQRTIREMREGNTGTVEMIKTLEAISRNPKGAKALAAETLAKVNGGKS